MKLYYFSQTTDSKNLKDQYRKLSLKYHPDRGGSEEAFKQINAEFNYMNRRMNYSNEETADTIRMEMKLYQEILDTITKFEGITIELIGYWLWISGNTYPYKTQFKNLGFKFSRKKMAWFYHYGTYKKRNKTNYSLQDIRQLWGSRIIENESQKYLAQ